MAIKSDMSKSYDSIEWDFLEAIFVRLRFGDKWVTWVMWCVKSVSFKVLINGLPQGHIK